MNPTERQYERIARRLDGEDVALSAEELAAAEDIRRGERFLAGRLDVSIPPEAMEHLRRRTSAELARPRRRTVKIGYVAAAAAAAAILIAVVSFRMMPHRPQSPLAISSDQAAEADALLWASEPDPAIDMLARELDELEAEILVSLPPAQVDMELEAIGQDIEEFWLDDPSAEPLEG